MELKEAILLLKKHNEWRRDLPHDLGDGKEMVNPKKLGIAIDKVVSEFENLFISDVVGRSEQLKCNHDPMQIETGSIVCRKIGCGKVLYK